MTGFWWGRGFVVCLFAFYLFCCPALLQSQHSFAELVGIDQGRSFPKDLLAGRSAVVVGDVSYAPSLHQALLRASVDAVAYFQEDELLSGAEPTGAFVRWMRKRDIRTLLFFYPLSTLSDAPSDTAEWGLSIAAFSGDGRLVASDASAWHTRGTMRAISDHLYGEVYSAGLRQENFLLPDEVELFRKVRIPRKKFLATYPQDIKNATLAVAVPSYAMRDSQESGLSELLRTKLEAEQQLLEQALQTHYAHKYKLLSYSGSDKDVFDQGHQYLLLHMRGRESFLKGVFNRAVVAQQSSDSVLYMFYVKQVFTQDVFLGTTWSANTSMSKALRRFLGKP